MSLLSVQDLKRRLYPRPEQTDAVVAFRQMLESQVRPEHRVLDIGAGAGELSSYQLRGRCREIVGVDLDPRVCSNPLLDRGIQADAARLPLEDAAFDVVFSIYVLEHVADPVRFVAEVRRVLRPGGVYLALTPNLYHYVCLISRLTPNWFHGWFRRRHYGVHESDTFATYYRLNTRGDLRRHFEAQGFQALCLQTLEISPNYLSFSLPTFLAGVFYERLVNCTEGWADLRVNILACFRKPLDTAKTV